MAELALAWVLHNPNVAAAIIGASRPEQVRDNVQAASVRLEPDLIAAIEQVVDPVVVRDPAETRGEVYCRRPSLLDRGQADRAVHLAGVLEQPYLVHPGREQLPPVLPNQLSASDWLGKDSPLGASAGLTDSPSGPSYRHVHAMPHSSYRCAR